MGRFLFLLEADFSSFSAPEPVGTFVPMPDCFRNEGAMPPRRAHLENGIENRGRVMLSWVVTFLIIALIAGVLGFGGVAGASVEIAKIIFFIAIVLFLVSAVVGLARGRTRV
jgi:uncharacterized membrane protein YtjA (UPF0391 family)